MHVWKRPQLVNITHMFAQHILANSVFADGLGHSLAYEKERVELFFSTGGKHTTFRIRFDSRNIGLISNSK